MKSHSLALMSAGLISLSACSGVGVVPSSTTTSSSSSTSTTPSTTVTSTWSGAPTSSSTPGTPTTPTATGTTTATVSVFFLTEAASQSDCSAVRPFERRVNSGTDALTKAMTQLLQGPTAQEYAAGARSFFSSATAGALLSARTNNGVAYVNLRDIRQTIPNASTSCGSASLIASMTQTAKAASGARAVNFAIQRQPQVFWEWLQMSCPDDLGCDASPFGP